MLAQLRYKFSQFTKYVLAQLWHSFRWNFVRVFIFNIIVGGTGFLLIAYELLADPLRFRTQDIDKIADFFSAAVTFVGVILTASSIYFYSGKTSKPDPGSKWLIAPLVIISCLAGLYYLATYGTVPANIVNGFALLGIAGGLLRIQPNPQRAAESF